MSLPGWTFPAPRGDADPDRWSPVDVAMMDRALALATRAWGRTHPNPMVGAVLARADGTVLAEGWHARAGGPHAEVACLEGWPATVPPDATLHVTLEPCCTHGRTPPCTDLVLRRGVRRVVVAATDPNPRHAGRGLDLLRAAGVTVETGLREGAARSLNLVFDHWIRTGRPFVAAKVAMTLDGRTATRAGASQWITGGPARLDVHRWRDLFPAIATGAGTVAADNPALTIRGPDGTERCARRYVLDGSLRLAGLAPRLFTDSFAGLTTLVTVDSAPAGPVRRVEALGVHVLRLPAEPGQPARPRWDDFLAHLAAQGVTGLLVEAGANLLGDLIARRAIDHLFLYHAPLLLGDPGARAMAEGPPLPALHRAMRLRRPERVELGDDLLTHGAVEYPPEARPEPLVLATGNAHKAAEFRALAALHGLDFAVRDATAAGGMPEVDESGSTFAANAAIKARALAAAAPAGSWVLADDSGLEVDALGGRPGIRSARFAGPRATDADNRAALLAELGRVAPGGPWPARFRCALHLVAPDGRELAFEGRCEGHVVAAGRGDGGFGYDRLFVPEGHGSTFGELPAATKDAISHRARAFAELARWRLSRPA